MTKYRYEMTMPSRQTTDASLRDVAEDQGAKIKIEHRGANVYIESTKVITMYGTKFQKKIRLC